MCLINAGGEHSTGTVDGVSEKTYKKHARPNLIRAETSADDAAVVAEHWLI